MKKFLVLLTISLLLVGLAAGCGGGDKKPAAAPVKSVKMILATGGTAGTYYPFGGAIAQIWNSKIPGMNVTAQATGASVENIKLVNKKEAELAMVQTDIADYAANSKEMFKESMNKVRGIAILYPEYIKLIVRTESGIKSIADLKGKKVSVGAPGSGNEANARQLLDIYGLDYKQVTPLYLSYAETAEQFKDKHLDAFLMTTGIPNSAVMDIATQHNITLLSIPDDMIAKAIQKYPFMAKVTIPANTYKGQTAAVNTVAVQAVLVVNADVDEATVYNLTKTMFDNQPDLAKAHAKGKELSLEKAIKGISIPLHPGAIKFYKEKGIIK